ncbi:hypothetical protein ACWKSP_06135 [Micromonosporaceae bacterium Da 78-11]
MTRRKTFNPAAVQAAFWRRDDIRMALARREVGRLFAMYLDAHPDCTQTQLALITEHDRSDISNFVRGTRSPRVGDIDVLGRIADGLAMPDEARVLLGLAPADATMSSITAKLLPPAETQAADSRSMVTGWYKPASTGRPLRLAICGSRGVGVNDAAVDTAVAVISRLLMNRQCEVDHGPMGVGMEIMTYIADHYRPPALLAAVGVFGRANVVRNAHFVLVVGGGHGTLDEIDLAVSMAKRLIPFPHTGGAARHAYERMHRDVNLRAWLPDEMFDALGSREQADDVTEIVEQILSIDPGSPARE